MVNLPIEYSDKPVTPFGGMALLKRFVDRTGIREHLAGIRESSVFWIPPNTPTVP
ncbi:MAG: hypothetical protein WAW39_04040 [Prosthecobacter sp.]|uniref:hypothetical protein n=1 Tax=Prosthecobacter sp. TaxID=1965333 RepID=UPI003BAE9E8B